MTTLPYGCGIWLLTLTLGQVFAFLNKQRDLNLLPIAFNAIALPMSYVWNPPSRA